MKKYTVYNEGKAVAVEYADTMKEAIRFARMLLLASGVVITDENWYAVEIPTT